MHRVALFLVSLLAWPLCAAELNLDFHQAALNQPPEGFRSTLTGQGPPGDWKIILEEGPVLFPPMIRLGQATNKEPVLAQLSRDQTDERYPMLIYEGQTFDDFKLTTQFKIVSGEAEQMAGIAFRIRDENNYYYIRASALGKTLYFFKRVEGQLIGPYGFKLEIPTNTWHELVIDCQGNQIQCQLNGKVYPTINDSSFTSGKIGFWTKSDSVSYFADTKVTYTRKEVLAQVLIQEALKKYPRLVGLKIYAPSTNQPLPRIIASTDPKEIGNTASKVEQDVIANGRMYHLKEKDVVQVTVPLRDGNGEIVAAARVMMHSFAEQTEKNAIVRAMPIVKLIESRFQRASELVQ